MDVSCSVVSDFSSSRISPEVGGNSPAIIESNVVFPQPLGPIKEINSPFSISMLIFSSAV